jgi:hypothetical protein
MSLDDRLHSIEIEGFQALAKPALIELSDVTLLYGPNAAGKSAVEDALRLLADFWGVAVGSEGGQRNRQSLYQQDRTHALWYGGTPQVQALSADWHIGPNGERAPSLRIAVTTRVESLESYAWYWGDRSSVAGQLSMTATGEPAQILRAEVQFANRSDGSDQRHLFPALTVSLAVDDQLLLRIEQFGEARLNIAHPLVQSLGMRLPKCSRLSPSLADIASVDSGAVVIRNLMAFGHGPAEIISNEISQLRIQDIFNPPFGGDPDERTLRDAVAEFATALNVFLSMTRGSLTDVLGRLGVVSASRKVPTDDELTFVYKRQGESVFPTKDSRFAQRGDVRYDVLARSVAMKHLVRDFQPKTAAVSTPDESDRSLVERVNGSLTGALFRERGYFVDGWTELIVGADEVVPKRGAHPTPASDIQGNLVLVTLKLKDAQNRCLSFTDVGSGLGYSLPVLTALWSESLSLIQQPELHLHPALQSGMADVFIDAAHEGHFAIIETHSEHLLLRILRRIRDTARNPFILADQQLIPSQVSVLYFDPQPDGATVVKRLRISSDGDFLDRWPRGFFNERDGDLFDE